MVNQCKPLQKSVLRFCEFCDYQGLGRDDNNCDSCHVCSENICISCWHWALFPNKNEEEITHLTKKRQICENCREKYGMIIKSNQK